MITTERQLVQHTFTSEVMPDVSSDKPFDGAVIAWADTYPVAWKIVTQKRSKAFGVGSCEYIGWAQKSMENGAILARLHHLKNVLEGTDSGNSFWKKRAWFTFDHYQDKGFTGGFFQQHDERFPRVCCTLDYTPETLESVIDSFVAWCNDGCTFKTTTIMINGKTVRGFAI